MLITKWILSKQVSAEVGPTDKVKKSKLGQVGPTEMWITGHDKFMAKSPTARRNFAFTKFLSFSKNQSLSFCFFVITHKQ